MSRDSGWTYKPGDVFIETLATREEAVAAARVAAAEQQVGDETVPISRQDEGGAWHDEIASGKDRQVADVEE